MMNSIDFSRFFRLGLLFFLGLLLGSGLPLNGSDGSALLQKINGVPLIKIDGSILSHLMYSGGASSMGKPILLKSGWNKIQYSGIAPVSDSNALVQINLGGATGKVTIRNFSLIEEAEGKSTVVKSEAFADGSWTNDWKFIVGEKAQAKCELSSEGLRVTVDKRTDFPWVIQLAMPKMSIKEGTRYIISFEIMSSIEGWPLTSYLMRTTPLRFYASQDEEGQFIKTSKLAVKGGVDILSVLIHRLPWPENPEDYASEWKVIGQELDQIKKSVPGAKILLRFGVEPPPWWIRAHPEQMQTWEDGKTGKYVCIASEQWRSDVRSNVDKFVREAESRWGDLIIGYAPAAQSTGEWYYPLWDSPKSGFMNYSPSFRLAYQKWLSEKYGAVKNLNAAWSAPITSFAEIKIPSGAERLKSDLGVFRNPATQRALFDFYEFQQIAMLNAIDTVAKAIKEATGGKKLVFLFYGYLFELPGVPQGISDSGHLALGQLLRAGHVDGIIDIVSYSDRGAVGSGCLMTPVESILAHGRLLCTEDDSRTHLSAPNAGYERTTTPSETLWAQSRNLLRSLIHNGYTWKFDLYGQGWFDDENLWKELGALSRAYAETPPKPYDSDVAVIVDEASFLSLRPGIDLIKPLVNEFRFHISRTGATDPSWWLLEDVVAGVVPPHKLTIFLNAFYLSPMQRDALKRYCTRSGGTVLWMYAPGYLNDQGEDYAGMEELTGFRYTRHKKKTPTESVVISSKSEGAFSLLSPRQFPRLPAGVSDYFTVEPGKGVEELGRISGADGGIALAARNDRGFRSLFCAAPELTPEFLSALEKQSGVWQYAPSGNIVVSNGRLLGVTSLSGGDVPISLPVKCRISSLNGDSLSESSDRLVPHFQPGETKIFVITPVSR